MWHAAGVDGTWSGLLFDNPVVRLPPALTWSFRLPFGDSVLELDWLAIDSPGRWAMAGRESVSRAFADPGEAILDRHRFDRIALRVTGQEGDLITVAVTVAGDLDGFGREEVTVAGRLRFGGFTVQLSDVSSGDEALARLGALTDTTGLAAVPDPRGVAFLFGGGGSQGVKR
jgi:hypothetical protein